MPYRTPFDIRLSKAIHYVVDKKELKPQVIRKNYLSCLNEAVHDDFINRFRSELIKLLKIENTNQTSHYFHSATRPLKPSDYQRIYDTLIYLAMCKPLNERQDDSVLCPITWDKIPAKKIITVSSGYRYNIDALVQCTNLKDPITNEKFCLRDIQRIHSQNTKSSALKKIISLLPSLGLSLGLIALGVFIASVALIHFLSVPTVSMIMIIVSVLLIKRALTNILNIIKDIKNAWPKSSTGPDEQAEESASLALKNPGKYSKPVQCNGLFSKPVPDLNDADNPLTQVLSF